MELTINILFACVRTWISFISLFYCALWFQSTGKLNVKGGSNVTAIVPCLWYIVFNQVAVPCFDYAGSRNVPGPAVIAISVSNHYAVFPLNHTLAVRY